MHSTLCNIRNYNLWPIINTAAFSYICPANISKNDRYKYNTKKMHLTEGNFKQNLLYHW